MYLIQLFHIASWATDWEINNPLNGFNPLKYERFNENFKYVFWWYIFYTVVSFLGIT